MLDAKDFLPRASLALAGAEAKAKDDFRERPIDILRYRVCCRKRLRKNVYGDAVDAVTFGLEGPDGRNAG